MTSKLRSNPSETVFGPFALILALGCLETGGLARGETAALARALTFYASFDRGPDADFGEGDHRIFTIPSLKHPRKGTPGLPADGSVTVARGAGKVGDALQFHRKTADIVHFQAKENLAYANSNWSGTVSFWLRLDPDTDLEPGYCDPLQITPREWNDAALWVDFSKDERPRHLRLGAFADRRVWDPELGDVDKMPEAKRPMVTVTKPPFGRDHWTHVAFTFSRFNTGKGDGVATLYLDAKPQGTVSARRQTFSWEPGQALVMVGIYYTGLFDELAFFDRDLSAAEVEELFSLKGAVGALRGKE